MAGGRQFCLLNVQGRCYDFAMSKAEILAELPHLTAEELAEVQAKLDELAGHAWQDHGELTPADKEALGEAIAAYEKSPDSGSSWEEVEKRIRAKLKP
jgi:hypothetical protein